MSNFVNDFSNKYCKSAACGTHSSCVASFDFVGLTGTVFAVSVFLFALILASLGLIKAVVLLGILLNVLICLKNNK